MGTKTHFRDSGDRSGSLTRSTGKKFNAIIIGSLVLAVIEEEQKSIAVLPFVNMSSDKEQEFFSDGITEEILNSLASVKELKVAGRTSSFAFKGQNDDLRRVGGKQSKR